MKKKLCLLLSLLILLGSLTAMHASQPEEADTDAQTRNLHKLAKVWGFTKYTHMAFLTGEKCWDEELLNLIPVIRAADEEDVNDILYEWFVGLGDSGFGNPGDIVFAQARPSDALDEEAIMTLISRLNEVEWPIEVSWGADIDGIYADVVINADDMPLLVALEHPLDFTVTVIDEADVIFSHMAEPQSWICETFLGANLYTALSGFQRLPVIDRSAAPIVFGYFYPIEFGNEPAHRNMDFSGDSYRLLGLFRLWNVMEYYFPYRDILDRCWSELLLEHIPMMLEGNDRVSYELTLFSLASNLHDAHIVFEDTIVWNVEFGRYVAAVFLTEAEGQAVVLGDVPGVPVSHELIRGDIIVGLDGRDIEEIIARKLRYVPFPHSEIALAYLTRSHALLRSHEPQMTVDIIRDGVEMTVNAGGRAVRLPIIRFHMPAWNEAAVILDNNIGLINPWHIRAEHGRGSAPFVMNVLSQTDGLIIDMRQSTWGVRYTLPLEEYLVCSRQRVFNFTAPAAFAPGVFIDTGSGQYRPFAASDDAFLYPGNVVILMDERVQSSGEFLVMIFRLSPNVTVIGSNSIGANGTAAWLPLPGGMRMVYTGLGIFTPEGGQTQRIGLSPDIFVRPTIEGIREGRDEVLEAAIEFLLYNR